ncbi:hypothetical protein DFR60_112149 [Hungatella effluvii]|uniref:DUF234 domain-containing protein n=1 Tax=Hungatella effluvii TaxID=1096246 RepID=A0A2V3XZD8_9FIRM|nr:ATP-binding protein [Hungatella effluvii]PXX50286.1 hypothetical protein DFR60_112149 [Hungatella effluvii]
MFIGRERELQKLNSMYAGNTFEFAVFYGRRRVGKTTLITEFIKNKHAIYYMASEGTQKENLAGLSRAVLQDNLGIGVDTAFRDFSALLDYIDTICNDRQLILAVDEYPYLAASCPAISSLIQKHIDQCWKNSRLFLILCGSSMSFMEYQVLGYKSPLYGRRTAQFKIHPFTYFESRAMLDVYPAEEQAVLYGVTGGIPEYLSRLNLKKSMDENIVELFFQESGRLFEEPVNLLKQELKEPATYHSMISAIAGGASRLNEIAVKTGLESSGCSNQMMNLISLGIVRKETPVTEDGAGRKTLYRLEDNMFLFWYRFVRPNISSIVRGNGEGIYEHVVKPELNDFMGRVFEEICHQYLYLPNVYSKLPCFFGEIGRWWGNNPKEKKQEEIDIMAVQGNIALFGECKWRNTKVSPNVLETLLRRSELFHYQEKQYVIFSKSGFEQAVMKQAAIEQAKGNAVWLISFDEMTGNEGQGMN